MLGEFRDNFFFFFFIEIYFKWIKFRIEFIYKPVWSLKLQTNYVATHKTIHIVKIFFSLKSISSLNFKKVLFKHEFRFFFKSLGAKFMSKNEILKFTIKK